MESIIISSFRNPVSNLYDVKLGTELVCTVSKFMAKQALIGMLKVFRGMGYEIIHDEDAEEFGRSIKLGKSTYP